MKKTIFFEGAGITETDISKKTDLTNCRIRGIVKNSENRYIYLECTAGIRLNRKYTKLPKKEYETRFPYENYLHIDHCFYLDIPQDYYNNYSKDLQSFNRRLFYHLPYNKKSLLYVLNTYLKCDFANIEVLNKGYSVHEDIEIMGFHKNWENNKIIKPNKESKIIKKTSSKCKKIKDNEIGL